MGRRISGLPALPTEGVPQAQLVFFNAVKEALEKLIGIRGDPKLGAVLRGDITVTIPAVQANLNATGAAFPLGGVNVASGEDHATLIGDVRQLIIDVRNLRAAVDALRKQLSTGAS